MTERQPDWTETWEPKENEFAHLIWVHRDDAPGHWLSWKEAEVKLACAARNSYAKHFGARAIAAAESDALGRLILSLQEARDTLCDYRYCNSFGRAVGENIAALLRELEGT